MEHFQTQLYLLGQYANNLVKLELDQINLLTVGMVALAGLLTSLTPCMLSMLPLTIAYIGGYENQGKFQGALQSAWFALGLATTLAGMGVIAAALGQVYGQIGSGLPIVVSLVAIIMGLNLLEIINLRFPSLGPTSWIKEDLPPAIRSYLLGLTFGLIASPCSTPVLATLLAWVASTKNFQTGSLLLLAYTMGYVSPLIIAGTFTSKIKDILSIRKWSGWINTFSGAILIGFGVISLLSRVKSNL